MYQKEIVERLEQIMEKEAFVEKLAEAATEEEMCELFRQEGIQMESGDVAAIVSELEKYRESDELTDEMLDQVSGGFITLAAYAAGVATTVVVGYVTYKIAKFIIDKKHGC